MSVVALLTVFATRGTGFPSKWTDSTGKFSVEAQICFSFWEKERSHPAKVRFLNHCHTLGKAHLNP